MDGPEERALLGQVRASVGASRQPASAARAQGQAAPQPRSFVVQPEELQLQPPAPGAGAGDRWLGVCQGRECSVKLLPLSGPQQAQEALARRVLQLARTAAACPHAPEVVGVTVKDGALAIATPRHSHTLLQHLQQQPGGKLSPGAALTLARGVLQALTELHSRGVVLGDLHPSGVVLSAAGQPQLPDAGLSVAFASTCGRHCAVHEPPGCWHYTAPELFAATPDDPHTPASDMWALGAVLLFAVTGQLPWSGSSAAQLALRVGVQKEVPALPPNLPPALQQLLRRLLRAEPTQRPSAAVALQDVSEAMDEALGMGLWALQPVQAGAGGAGQAAAVGAQRSHAAAAPAGAAAAAGGSVAGPGLRAAGKRPRLDAPAAAAAAEEAAAEEGGEDLDAGAGQPLGAAAPAHAAPRQRAPPLPITVRVLLASSTHLRAEREEPIATLVLDTHLTVHERFLGLASEKASAHLWLGELNAATEAAGIRMKHSRFLLLPLDALSNRDLVCDVTAALAGARGLQLSYSPSRSAEEAERAGRERTFTLLVADVRWPAEQQHQVELRGPWGSIGPQGVRIDYAWTLSDLKRHVRAWLPEPHRNSPLTLLTNGQLEPHQPCALFGTHEFGQRQQHVLAAPDEPHVSITVSMTTGRECVIQVQTVWDVEDLMLAIQEKMGIPADQQRLIYASRQLEVGASLHSYGIGPGSTVYLLLRLRAGKPVICVWPREPTQLRVRLSLSPAWSFSSLVPRPDCSGDGGGGGRQRCDMSGGVGGRYAEWHVTAQPDGTLTHAASGGRAYSYLFWEALTEDGAGTGALQRSGSGGSDCSSGMGWSGPGAEGGAALGVAGGRTERALTAAAAASSAAGPAPIAGLPPPPPDLPIPDFDPARSFCVAGGEVEAWLYSALEAFGLPTRERTDMLTYWLPHMEGAAWLLVAFADPAHYQAAAALDVHPAPDALLRLFMLFERLHAPVPVHGSLAAEVARVGVLRREGARLAVLEWGGMEVVRGAQG